MSTERGIKGGAPQGTELGNILFCLTVEDIEESEEAANEYGSAEEEGVVQRNVNVGRSNVPPEGSSRGVQEQYGSQYAVFD